MKLLVKNLFSSSVAMLMLAFSVPANAYDAGDMSEVQDILEKGISGSKTSFGSDQTYGDEYKSEYEYTHTSDGVEFESTYSYGKDIDFGDYVNTSAKTVRLLDISSSSSAGMSLGCSGLNFGAESLFKFEAEDFLEDLKSYATTKLATEALAMIYATPLVSTVMDGIKSMNNFVAEFEQASCDMTSIKTRADEIKQDRIDKCLDKLTENGKKATASAREKCYEPGALDNLIKEFQCTMSNQLSTGGTLGELFGADMGIGGATNIEGEQATVGSFLASLIPDVRYSMNGGGNKVAETTPALRPIEEVNTRAFQHTKNVILGIYRDFEISLGEADVTRQKDIETIIEKTENYKRLLLTKGSVDVYSDQSAQNISQHSTSYIDRLRTEIFKDQASVQYKTVKAATGRELFKIGKDQGMPNGIVSSSDTSYRDHIKKYLLRAGELCFTKTPQGSSGNYKWAALHTDPQAILGLKDLDTADRALVDTIVERVSICTAINHLDIGLIRANMLKDKTLGNAFIDKLAAEAAYAATQNVQKVSSDKMTDAITNDTAMLIKQCQDNGGAGAMVPAASEPLSGGDCKADQAHPETGVPISGTPYQSCEQYADENKLTEEKKQAMRDMIAQQERALKSAETEMQRYKDKYDINLTLYTATK